MCNLFSKYKQNIHLFKNTCATDLTQNEIKYQ